MFSVLPPHLDAAVLARLRLTRALGTLPHKQWWQDFLHDTGGTGFWHEAYLRGGTMESVFIDMPPVRFARFAPVEPARGTMFSARRRLGRAEESELLQRCRRTRSTGRCDRPADAR